MKKLILLTMCMVLIGTGAAMADTIVTFTNNTTVTENTGGNYTYPNVIGDSNYFATPGGQLDVTTGVLTINTNWDPAKDGYIDSRVKTAYLFVSQGGNVWAINLEASTGNVFKNPGANIQTSFDIFNPNPLGGYGEFISGSKIPVAVTGMTATGNIAVTWNAYSSSSIDNSFNLDLLLLSGLQSGVAFDILWGTAQCANGPITADFPNGVPLPPSALLLGTGLLGLVGLGWRRRQSS